MAKRKNIMRSHAERVRTAKQIIETDPQYCSEPISFLDREAFVEYLLLVDIVKLYEGRLERETKRVVEGRAGEMSKKANIQQFRAIINVIKAAREVAHSAINSGKYKKVWKAIHEGALMSAAKDVSNLPELRELAIDMLRDLSTAALEAVGTDQGVEEDLDDLQSHEENVRRLQGLPSASDIEEVIRAAEEAIPDRNGSDKRRKSSLDPNT